MDNRTAILRHIWNNPGVCRKEIATKLGFHPNVVSNMVRELIEESWVSEGDSKATKPGRAPISLQLDVDNRAAVAVTYHRAGAVCALVNARGDIIQKVELETAIERPEDFVESIAQMLERLSAKYRGQLIGIGVADPGMVDSARGEIVRSSMFPHWHGLALARLLEARTNLPVLLEDVSRLRAMGQYLIAPELRRAEVSTLYIDYGEGIGFALVMPDGIWRGSGFAGEVGHVVLEQNGALCRCGARGCLESLANESALTAKVERVLAQGVTSILQGAKQRPSPDAVFEAALNGDRMAKGVVKEIMVYLNQAVAFMVTAFHPKYLVVGGKSRSAIQCLSREIKQAMEERVLPEIASTVEIIEGKESGDLELTGAAFMVFAETITQGGKMLNCRA